MQSYREREVREQERQVYSAVTSGVIPVRQGKRQTVGLAWCAVVGQVSSE